MKFILQKQPNITWTVKQMKLSLKKGYFWLCEKDKHQRQVLSYLVRLGFQRLTQQGFAKKIKTIVSIERQWMWYSGFNPEVQIDVTGDNVAHTDAARKLVSLQPVNPNKLHQANYAIQQ